MANMEPREDLYTNQEARLRFEAYRFARKSKPVLFLFLSLLPKLKRLRCQQPFAGFSSGLRREPCHSRDRCYRWSGD